MWSRVKKFDGCGTGLSARERRKVPAVQRGRTGSRAASALSPEDMLGADRCDVFSDGNGRLAFHFSPSGEYIVHPSGPSSRTSKVTIPGRFANRVPYGTTDVAMSKDGDMWVLDLNKIQTAA